MHQFAQENDKNFPKSGFKNDRLVTIGFMVSWIDIINFHFVFQSQPVSDVQLNAINTMHPNFSKIDLENMGCKRTWSQYSLWIEKNSCLSWWKAGWNSSFPVNRWVSYTMCSSKWYWKLCTSLSDSFSKKLADKIDWKCTIRIEWSPKFKWLDDSYHFLTLSRAFSKIFTLFNRNAWHDDFGKER